MQQELYMTEEQLRRYRIKKIFSQIGIYLFLVLIALFIVIPFYWMIATALRSTNELGFVKISFFPKEWHWENFPGALSYAAERSANFFRFYLNTIIVGAATTTFSMVSIVFAAFAFSRLNFRGRDALFSLFLATMMIPGEIYIISNFGTISRLGLLNTYSAMVIPFIVDVFFIFFLRQTFKQIPNELYLAAKVDGTGDFKYLFKVMIPMSRATLTTIFILSMMGTWNAYIWPNLVATEPKMYLVSNGLLQIYRDIDGAGQILNYQMAAATMVTVPLLIVFMLLKKYIMYGVSRSGIKG
ncbi:MAG TPA: carbohydrate ABC transporter permease [Acholeplasmataceae bacterium]|jgi:multiple sugar transport system permease protein|nr:carbohydrate ABC transporter permease [Acholeplasmataceae bacterium]